MANTVAGVLPARNTHASRPAATAVTAGSLFSCSDHDLVYRSDGSAWATWADLTGTGSVVTVANAQQGADVAVGSATYTNVTSVSLAAGTWDIWGFLNVQGGNAGDVYAQVWDGSAQLAQMVSRLDTNTTYLSVPVFASSVVLGSTTTIYLRTYMDNGGTAKGSTSLGTGGGSKIHARRIT